MALIETPKILKSNEVIALPTKEEADTELTRRILTFIETHSWFHEEYPRVKEIAQHFNIPGQRLRKVYLPEVDKLLERRGLKKYDEKAPVGELDPFFVMACNLIVDISDKRSRTMKLKTLDKTSRWFEQQLLKKENKEFFNLRVEQTFSSTSLSAKLGIAKNVEAGDLQSIKYFHEFTGIHDPNKEITSNLYKLIGLFMEVLAQHVGKEIIEAVSRDFDTKLLELG